MFCKHLWKLSLQSQSLRLTPDTIKARVPKCSTSFIIIQIENGRDERRLQHSNNYEDQ